MTLPRRQADRAERVNARGGAIFFVSNDRSGTMTIEDTDLAGQPAATASRPADIPGIFFLGARPPTVIGRPLSR